MSLIYGEDRTERDYEEDFEQAIDHAIKLIDVDKYDFDDAILTASRKFSVNKAELASAVDLDLA